MIQLYINILFHILFHDGLSQGVEYSSLCSTVIVYPFVYSQFASANPKLPILPSLTCPLGNPSLFSMSVSLFLFHREVHLCHISDSIDKWCHIVFVFLFLTYSLSMIISRSIHVATSGIILFFLWLNNSTLYIFLIHLSMDI